MEEFSSQACKFCAAVGVHDLHDPIAAACGEEKKACAWSEYLPGGGRKGSLCAYCAALHRSLYPGLSRAAMAQQLENNVNGAKEKHQEMRKLLITQWTQCDRSGNRRRFLPKQKVESLQQNVSTRTELKPVCKQVLYTPTAYQETFLRSHVEDGLPLRNITTPSGQTMQMVVVQDGPKGVYELSTSDVQEVVRSQVLDDGTEQLHDQQIADSYQRAAGTTSAANSWPDAPSKQDLMKRTLASSAAASCSTPGRSSQNNVDSDRWPGSACAFPKFGK